MKKLLYYLAIAAAFIVVWLLGSFICAWLNTAGTFPMLLIACASIGAAKLSATLLKERLTTDKNITENEQI